MRGNLKRPSFCGAILVIAYRSAGLARKVDGSRHLQTPDPARLVACRCKATW